MHRLASLLAPAAALALTLTVACFDDGTRTVLGERAGEGTCPEDETCSDEVPHGLYFRGQMLYDEGADRLGPVLVGGRFDLVFRPVEGEIDGFDVTIEGDSLEAKVTGDHDLALWGTASGSSTVRIVDPDTGELYDRLTLETVTIDDVELHNVVEEDRPFLYAGCEEMIGMRLIADGGRLRAFDQDATVTAPTEVEPDPFVWDCFTYEVPPEEDTVVFEVEAGGQRWEREVPVVPLPPGRSCPEMRD